MAHKTIAWPLALAYTALIVFASLFPFEGWRAQGISPWEYASAPLPPPYWTGFDIGVNIVGYMPLGFLLALAWLRRGHSRRAWPLAALAAMGLSLLLELLQIYLPLRVASNLDFLLNSAGAWLGAASAAVLERLGAIDHWSRFRARWFLPQSHATLVLLALWPAALLFPTALPLGLGQVLERVQRWAASLLEDSSFAHWLPAQVAATDPLSPALQALCVLLGALIPCLLAYSAVRTLGQRVISAALALGLGVGVTALSSALTWGPAQTWQWAQEAWVRAGLIGALLCAAALLALPRRACMALALLALALHLNVLNLAPTDAYFAQTLQLWEQGRFLRFYGLSQWLGWLWPYAALVVVLLGLSRREGQTYNRAP